MIKGLHVHFSNDVKGNLPLEWPTVDYDCLRLWDAGVAWMDLEPRKGEFEPALLDALVEGAMSRGKSLVWTLGYTPLWAALDPTLPGDGVPGGYSSPKNPKDLRDFLVWLVTRYRGKIQYYEGWNEWGFGTTSNVDVVAAAEMQAILWEVVKTFDPAAKVLSAPPGYSMSGNFQTGLIAMRGHFDIAAVHGYASSQGELDGELEQNRGVVDLICPGTPLWCTEFGWCVGNGQGWEVNFSSLTPQIQADWLQHELDRFAMHNFDAGFFYDWNGAAMGMKNALLAQAVWNKGGGN